MTSFWTKTVKRLTPYVPGEQRAGSDIVKLNTNENPYPPSPLVIRAIGDVNGHELRRYPDPESTELRQALADYHQLELQQVFVGNGSDEILALVFMAFFTTGKPLQFPSISYSFYPVYCNLYGIEPAPIEMEDDYSLDLQRFTSDAGGFIFPNPNAPTALATDIGDIDRLLTAHADIPIVVDEAYADFGAASAIDLLAKHENLIVIRTFSKGRSLAGLRLGAAFGSKHLIEGLQRLKNSFNSYPVDAIAQAAGKASLLDETYYRKTLSRITATREDTVMKLESRGYRVLPSSANFLFVSPPGDGAASKLFRSLNDAGVLIRYWSAPRLQDWLRISIGTDPDMQRLLSAIDA